jgi:hypothetical protein
MVLTLVFTMLAPAVCSLLDVELTSIVMKDFAEEETQKKGENESLEKDVFVHYLDELESYTFNQMKLHFGFYAENVSTVISEIVLPPPESLV